MEDVVAIKVRDNKNGWFAFMTWGRLWENGESDELVEAVRPFLDRFEGITEPAEVNLCKTLREVRDAPYFYEGLIEFSRSPIPVGERYKKWRKSKREALKKYGEDLYFLGAL